MSFFVTVRFVADPKRAKQVLDENPDLDRDIRQGMRDYGVIRTTRLVGDGQFLDIDEWPSEHERNAYVKAMLPQLERWNELMGVEEKETHTWRLPEPDEEF